MKKVITIMCVAAAPILFAQEKSLKASANESIKTEQQAKQEKKANHLESKKKVEAEKIKQKEVKAVQNSGKNVSRESSVKAISTETKKK